MEGQRAHRRIGALVCLLVSNVQQLCQISILQQFFHFYFVILLDYSSRYELFFKKSNKLRIKIEENLFRKISTHFQMTEPKNLGHTEVQKRVSLLERHRPRLVSPSLSTASTTINQSDRALYTPSPLPFHRYFLKI